MGADTTVVLVAPPTRWLGEDNRGAVPLTVQIPPSWLSVRHFADKMQRFVSGQPPSHGRVNVLHHNFFAPMPGGRCIYAPECEPSKSQDTPSQHSASIRPNL
jgi:hypothetical protein